MRPNDMLRGGIVGLSLLAALGAASAQDAEGTRMTGLKISGDQPIQIESDRLEVREAESTAVFSGNVSVTQGETLLKSGRMTVYYAKSDANAGASGGTSAMTQGASNIDRLEVDGKVYVKSAEQVATGDKGTFDMATETMVLTGEEVVLTEGDNIIVGCKLTVTMKTGLAKLDGCGKGSGRVKMLLQPKSQPGSQSQ